MADAFDELPVTSPTLPVDEGIVRSPKHFSDVLTLDLEDEEIQRAYAAITRLRHKYQERFRARFGHAAFSVDEAMQMIDQMEDEVVDRLAEMDILAAVDCSPIFEGKPLTIELLGALPSHKSARYGLDHERKEWEVKKSQELGLPFLGADRLG
jgi:hypothetical protein